MGLCTETGELWGAARGRWCYLSVQAMTFKARLRTEKQLLHVDLADLQSGL